MAYELSSAADLEGENTVSGCQTFEQAQFSDLSLSERIWYRLGRVVAATGVIIAGTGILTPTEASANEPACYGDYCSGQYADEMGCDEDARTIAEAIIVRTGVEVSLEVRGIGVGTGNTDSNEVGRLELRASDRCGTVWGRLNNKAGTSVDFGGINLVGAQQDGGYVQSRDIAGTWTGSPPAVSFSPMIYGRGREYRAFVEAGVNFINSKNGTYWVEGPK